jgi:hypothetical protein
MVMTWHVWCLCHPCVLAGGRCVLPMRAGAGLHGRQGKQEREQCAQEADMT